MSDMLEINAAEFKANASRSSRTWKRGATARSWSPARGKPIAELTAPKREAFDLYGRMKGRVIIPPGVDLTEPILEDIPEAELGYPIE